MQNSERSVLPAAMLVLIALITTAASVPDDSGPAAGNTAPASTRTVTPTESSTEPAAGRAPQLGSAQPGSAQSQATASALPEGRRRIFGGGRFLVAYYGTAQTSALGVLGESAPAVMHRRLERAAAPFRRGRQPVQPVYELIVTIADRYAGKGGDYAHDIAQAAVQTYIDAAHRHGALLLLDIQPGRTDFLTAAKRWSWALRYPHVGLALDPEWRMGRHGVPGHRIGSVGAGEVNRVSAWLRDLVSRHALPQKLLVLHQFRTDMVTDPARIRPRHGVVMVQHVDGFGSPRQKLDTFRTVARPGQFVMGFKLFYDEDVPRMSAADVRRMRPRVRFVSFQ